MSDLSTLMQYSPYAGSFLIGNKFAQDRQTEQLKQQELAQSLTIKLQEAQQKSELHPFEVESKKLGNKKSEYELPGVLAKSEQEQLKSKGMAETYRSDVDATIAKNEGDVRKVADDDQGRKLRFLGATANELMTIKDPLQRAMRWDEAVKGSGLKLNPGLRQLASQNPAMVMQLVDRLSQTEMMANPASRASVQNNQATNSVRVSEGAKDRAAQVQVAQIGADSRLAIAREKAAAAAKAKTFDEALTSGKATPLGAALAARNEALKAPDEETRNFWLKESERYERLHYNSQNARNDGRLGFGQDGQLTPRSINPVMGQDPKAKDDGLSTKSGTKYKILP